MKVVIGFVVVAVASLSAGYALATVASDHSCYYDSDGNNCGVHGCEEVARLA